MSNVAHCPQRYSFDGEIRTPADLVEFIPGFLERRQKEVEQVQKFIEETNFSGIALIGHKLRGTGTSYGFPCFSAIGKDLEEAAQARNTDQLHMLAKNFASLVDEVKAKVKL